MFSRLTLLAGIAAILGCALASASWALESRALLTAPKGGAGPPGGAGATLAPSSFVDAGAGLAIGERRSAPSRPIPLTDLSAPIRSDEGPRLRYEVAVALPRRVSGLWLDVALAQSATLAPGPDGGLARAGSATELRLGHGLDRLVRPWRAPTWQTPTWYIFAAADGQALTWRPDTALGLATDGLRRQDRVEVGDFQAGVSLEAGGLQASLAYVQREESHHDAQGRGVSADAHFTGVTLTWRR